MIDKNRILVLGGSGMVGSQVDFGIRPSLEELDITDKEAVARGFERYKPQAVLHLAGLVDVSICEANPGQAQKINVEGSANVADACSRADIPVVYFSTCMVFDGGKGAPYDEDDMPHPLTVYGETKFRGEQVILAGAPKALVARTGWLFGGFERDIKFIHKFHDRLIRGEHVRATSDRFGSPTYVPDLLSAVMRLLDEGACGIAHVVNDGVVSYYEVGTLLKELTRSKADVTPVLQREIDPMGALRGAMEGLVSNRGIRLRPYADALAEYVEKLRCQ